MQISELQNLLNREIPLSQHMGAQIQKIDPMELLMYLPLNANKNHKNTLFGGSLYAACALSCYGLFLSGLRDKGILTQNIVIADGNIRYLQPVTQDTVVKAEWPTKIEKSDFFDQLKAKGKARITMKATITENQLIACEFTGRFVAFNP